MKLVIALATLTICSAIAGFSIGVLWSVQSVDQQLEITKKAIDAANTWRGVAKQWETNSNEFEMVAHQFQSTALKNENDFAVCNSMLPVEKRM